MSKNRNYLKIIIMAAKNLNPITEAEAMKLLGYTNKYALRKANKPIRKAKLNHSTYVYSKTDIDQYIIQQFEKPGHKKTALASAVN